MMNEEAIVPGARALGKPRHERLLPLNPFFLYNPPHLVAQRRDKTPNNKEGNFMSKYFAIIVGAITSVVLNGAVVLANEPKGGAPDYSGVTGLYYTLIGLILVYGVYDAFIKKS